MRAFCAVHSPAEKQFHGVATAGAPCSPQPVPPGIIGTLAATPRRCIFPCFWGAVTKKAHRNLLRPHPPSATDRGAHRIKRKTPRQWGCRHFGIRWGLRCAPPRVCGRARRHSQASTECLLARPPPRPRPDQRDPLRREQGKGERRGCCYIGRASDKWKEKK